MKTAREFCHDLQRLIVGEDCGRFGDTCDEECDEFTAAIEARDAEWSDEVVNLALEKTAPLKAALEVAKGALERISYAEGKVGGCGSCWRTVADCDGDWTASNPGCNGRIARAALSRISTLVDPPGGKR